MKSRETLHADGLKYLVNTCLTSVDQ
uniref:Uncharacterized protein n=1 Tax=Tetranychus urticae TaxID=32264 RepID=T1L3R5_TETUR